MGNTNRKKQTEPNELPDPLTLLAEAEKEPHFVDCATTRQ